MIRMFIFVFLLVFSKNYANENEKWIVVTTIQYPTPQLKRLAQLPGWRLVVVGDRKTPSDWYLDNCEYLSPDRQLSLGYEIADLLPWNHYSRKNIGYLFAISQGAKVIYDTDDDNQPLGELTCTLGEQHFPFLITEGNTFNIYRYFGRPDVWPRGIPLIEIKNEQLFALTLPMTCYIGIEQGIVNHQPDVDAIFRFTRPDVVDFVSQETCVLPKGVFCPINSQNTFFDYRTFFALYLPSSVSMRVSDIWRGYIAQSLLWRYGSVVAFSGPNAVQNRNDHCILNDFTQESDLYLKSDQLLKVLSTHNTSILWLYKELFQKGFFRELDVILSEAWLRDLERAGYILPEE